MELTNGDDKIAQCPEYLGLTIFTITLHSQGCSNCSFMFAASLQLKQTDFGC